MEKPKKERKFLKAIAKIAKTLGEELVLGIGRKYIGKVVDKVVNKKREGLVIAFIILASSFVFAQFPTNTNKQRLGFQTTADGLVWRGSISDTAAIQPTTNQNAWLIIDTVNLKIYSFDFTSNVWGLVGGGGGLTMPFDSITFNTAKDGSVGVGEVEYNDTQGSLIQGLKGGNVTNVIGQQLHQRVNNRTGATLAKGTAVYLSGSQGNRITVAKALAITDAFSANTFGIVAESIADNQSGYVITEGLITGINTSALVQDSAVYLSPTVAGELTSTKPQAPQHTVFIGICVKSNAGSGELFVKIRNGQELDELHDVRITSPITNASLYYNGGLWRDTTAALLVSDTASMLSNYATKAYADTSGRFYARQDFTNVSSATLTWTQSDTLVVGGVNVVQVYRNGQILLPTQYTIPTNASVVIGATAYKVGENYTVIFPRGGGAGSGGGSGSLTSISGGTGITVSPNPITTTGTVSADLSVLMELTDTSLLNLNTRFASKLNAADTASLSNRINAKGTVSSVATGYGLSGGTITTTGTLVLDSATVFTRIRDSIVDVAIGNDTIKILKQEYPAQSSSILNWTVTSKFPIQLKAYILVFRNGQLLNNNQYDITDTAQITLVSTSFKSGANYTIATVSGIGSVGSAQGNPVYPEAGIALSTGTTWTTSITNNSSNWNTAFTDRLKWDGGSTGLVAATGRTSLGGTTIGQSLFTLTNPSAITFPRFNADNSVSALSAANFRSAIGAGTVTSVTAAGTSGNPISITDISSTPTIDILSATSARNGYLTSTDWTTFNNKQNAIGYTPANSSTTISTTAPLSGGGDLSSNKTLSIAQASTNTNGYLTSTDWNTFNGKQTQLNGTGFVKASGTSISYDNSTYLTTSSASSTYTPLTRSISTTSPLSGGGDLSANRTLSIANADADGSTKGAASFTAADFNASSGNISIDYTNGQAASGSAKGFLTSTDWTTFNNKQSSLTNPVTGTGVSKHVPRFTGTSTLDSSIIYVSGGRVGIGIDASTESGFLTHKFVIRDNDHYFRFDGSAAGSGYRTTFSHDDTGLKIGHSSNIRDIRFTLNGTSGLTIANNGNSPARAVGIGNDSPSHQLDVTGTFRATGAATLSSTLAVTGAITEGGNNVMTNLDTVSLSSRIDGKVGLTGNETVAGNKTLSGNTTMSGTVTMSSTSATPTGLLGINASNVIGDVTTVEQTGIFARGVITNQTTSSGGVVTLTHGLSWTPAIAFANLPDSNTNIVNVALIDATYILFVVRDGATNNVLNAQNVPAIQWFAIK